MNMSQRAMPASPARLQAMARQLEKCNDPESTRPTWDERRDYPRGILTGPAYRRQQESRRKMSQGE